jgi:hypothetical protein
MKLKISMPTETTIQTITIKGCTGHLAGEMQHVCSSALVLLSEEKFSLISALGKELHQKRRFGADSMFEPVSLVHSVARNSWIGTDLSRIRVSLTTNMPRRIAISST